MFDPKKDHEKTLRARSLVLLGEKDMPRAQLAVRFREDATELRAKGERRLASLFKRAAQQAERGWS